jgi:hypothetical protein
MTNDGQAQEVHATVTGSGHSREPANGSQAQRPDLGGDEEVIDPDAVIIEEVSAVPADDEASPVPAGDEASPVPAGDEASSRAADEPDRDPVAAAPATATIPEAARPGMPVDARVPAGSGRPGDTSGPADTDIVGDPENLHEQWAAIQSTFVDDPRGSVAAAAELVSETIAALVASAQERERGLRGEWDRDGVDTEGLRNALRSYRDLLDRLVRL